MTSNGFVSFFIILSLFSNKFLLITIKLLVTAIIQIKNFLVLVKNSNIMFSSMSKSTIIISQCELILMTIWNIYVFLIMPSCH